MPNAAKNTQEPRHIILAGDSGSGKSTLAYYGEGPFASLLLDKSSLDVPPGVDPASIYFKTYPPATVDLRDDKHGRARNIADAIIADIQLLRDHFTTGKTLHFKAGLAKDAPEEIWPTPNTVILEGGDFLAQHILNLVCARHKKANPSEFDSPFEAWGLRLTELHAIYDILTYLPCNLVVTTGLHREVKTSRVNGKAISEETGVILPNLGGAMCAEGPRKFHSCLMLYVKDGRHIVRTRSNLKYKGFKIGGKFGASEEIDVTVKAGDKNPWQKLWT